MRDHSPLVEVAAVLAALAAVPGIALAVAGGRLMVRPESLLMFVNGIVGFGLLAVGLAVTGCAAAVATGLLRRRPSARIGAVGLGAASAVAGGFTLELAAWWPPVLLAGGVALVVLMFLPTVAADLGPLLAVRSFPGSVTPAPPREPWWEVWRDTRMTSGEFAATTVSAVLLVLAPVLSAAGAGPYASVCLLAALPPLWGVERRLRARRQRRSPTATETAGPNG